MLRSCRKNQTIYQPDAMSSGQWLKGTMMWFSLNNHYANKPVLVNFCEENIEITNLMKYLATRFQGKYSL